MIRFHLNGMISKLLFAFCVVAATLSASSGQSEFSPELLDPTSSIAVPVLESRLHQPLPEQFVASLPATGDGTINDAASYFRRSFTVVAQPARATLYLAAPPSVQLFLNGELVADARRDPKTRTKPYVLRRDITRRLRLGLNVFALRIAGGDRFALKVVPRPPGEVGAPLVISDPAWKTSRKVERGWQQPSYDDSQWAAAPALGSIEGTIDFFQWNDDAEMYRWPGYDGISPFLARTPLYPERALEVFHGLGHLTGIETLLRATHSEASAAEFSVTLPVKLSTSDELPFFVLDFGREVDGRLEVASASNSAVTIQVQYGESLEEALHEPYLGVNELEVPPRAIAYGPKSAFRYAVVKFIAGDSPLLFNYIRADLIYYPVTYRGSFESSDPLLNRIWSIGAYTSHLCMLDDIWDAPKRDRGRWMGDLDVSGRVIDTVFADRFLMQSTLDHLIRDAGNPVDHDVNGIPGYSAFWIMGLADYYRHVGDPTYLASRKSSLLGLLDFLRTQLDDQSIFTNPHHAWPFVDWSPALNEDTPEARRATTFEFYKAFAEGAWLLAELGDQTAADRYRKQAEAIREAARSMFLDRQTDTYGARWQTNAMAIFSGVADDSQIAGIWSRVLSLPTQFAITPYYNFYVITAMAQAGHRQEALNWIRKYWGGMVQEGATSFWEAYDVSWPKDNFHASLQADNGQGYFVSLSHGWSSGPTAWLNEQILGIQPVGRGFSHVRIRPDLAGLTWARGREPTPQGFLAVDLKLAPGHTDASPSSPPASLIATIAIPPGVDALVSMPVATRNDRRVSVNGNILTGAPDEAGTRSIVRLNQPGTYELRTPQ